MNPAIHDYFAKMGAKGGKAGKGACKARDPEAMRKAGLKGARKRWGRKRRPAKPAAK